MTIELLSAQTHADIYDQLANRLKAASDPLRLEILRVLARDSYGVLELSSIFDIKQSGMSHHLKVLANADLVTTRREGNSIFYRRALPSPEQKQKGIQAVLFTTLDQEPLRRKTRSAISAVKAQRAETSKRFFAENTSKFRQQQDLIASYPVYAEQIQELLVHTPLPATACAVEIGPGEGEFLSVLSPRFERVIALDNARSMLEKARSYALEHRLNNIDFRCGEASELRQGKPIADCVVVNMVLHHAASPMDIFQDISATLRPGGALLITDLCHHDQSWVHDACGDVWLGFEPNDFSSWASAASLNEGQNVYFALRNGFQIQLRQFFKPQVFKPPVL